MTSDAPDSPDPEQLDEDALDALLAEQDAVLGSSLRALLEPPEDINERTTQVVDRALQGRSALSIGMRPLRAGVLDPAHDPQRRPRSCRRGTGRTPR